MKIEYEGRGTHLKVTQTSCKPSKFVVAPEYFHEYSKKKKKKKCEQNLVTSQMPLQNQIKTKRCDEYYVTFNIKQLDHIAFCFKSI